jgi:fatty-acid desaturase
MKKESFPYIALGLGLFLLLLVTKGSQTNDNGTTLLPLLTLLIVSEFAFFVNAIGAYIGIKHSLATGIRPLFGVVTLGCILLAAIFSWIGISLWPS